MLTGVLTRGLGREVVRGSLAPRSSVPEMVGSVALGRMCRLLRLVEERYSATTSEALVEEDNSMVPKMGEKLNVR